MAYGENDGQYHAERNALLKLPKRTRILKVNILVIRTTAHGHLGSSKPCFHCLYSMKHEALLRGYYISSVYYSLNGSEIVCERLDDMTNTHVTSFFKFKKRMRM
jgi:pyrimidine deaminase RibD-like protein